MSEINIYNLLDDLDEANIAIQEKADMYLLNKTEETLAPLLKALVELQGIAELLKLKLR